MRPRVETPLEKGVIVTHKTIEKAVSNFIAIKTATEVLSTVKKVKLG